MFLFFPACFLVLFYYFFGKLAVIVVSKFVIVVSVIFLVCVCNVVSVCCVGVVFCFGLSVVAFLLWFV